MSGTLATPPSDFWLFPISKHPLSLDPFASSLQITSSAHSTQGSALETREMQSLKGLAPRGKRGEIALVMITSRQGFSRDHAGN